MSMSTQHSILSAAEHMICTEKLSNDSHAARTAVTNHKTQEHRFSSLFFSGVVRNIRDICVCAAAAEHAHERQSAVWFLAFTSWRRTSRPTGMRTWR